jgi:hypothetical protein
MSILDLLADMERDRARQWEVVQRERDMIQARYTNLIRLTYELIALLPPPDVTAPDGRAFRFNVSDPQDTLRRLRDAADRMREEMQVPPAPGYNAAELRKRIESAMDMVTTSHYTRHDVADYLARALAGTCDQA